jgi:hypothetical protein
MSVAVLLLAESDAADDFEGQHGYAQGVEINRPASAADWLSEGSRAVDMYKCRS